MRLLPLLLAITLSSCSALGTRQEPLEPIIEGVLSERNYVLGAHVVNFGPVVDLTTPVLLPGRDRPVTYVVLLVYPEHEALVQSSLGKSVSLRCTISASRETEYMYSVSFCSSTGLVAP